MSGWFGQGTPEYERVDLVIEVLEGIAMTVDISLMASAFMAFLAPSFALMSDEHFERDVAELVNGLRLTRAAIQAEGQVKS